MESSKGIEYQVANSYWCLMPTSGNRVLENFQLKTVDCRVRLIKALNLAFDTKTPIRIIHNAN